MIQPGPTTTTSSMLTKLAFMAFMLFGILAISQPIAALESDQDQPATLDADEFDLDLQSGVRTYRGNVIYQQGSIRLTADEIVVYLNDGSLEKAIARGNPARFSQRPEGKDTDTVGTGLLIEMDEIARIVTLKNNATVTEGSNKINGKKITYNLDTERVAVKGGGSSTADTASQSTGDAQSSAKKPTRPRLVIQPRKKKKTQ